MPAYSAAICGRAAIQAFWQGCLDMGIGAMAREPSTIDCLVDTANEIGTYRFLDDRGQVLDVGKYVTIWKIQQGLWQIQCDIWTSNLPAAL
jgi:ketosteroid isomerase-like protein